jgi:guanine deaminase
MHIVFILSNILEKYGQRAFVGKVNMNQNSPDFYVESSKESLKETERLVLPCAVLLRTNMLTELLEVRVMVFNTTFNNISWHQFY